MIEIRAEMDASVWEIPVAEGDTVAAGDELLILESMKMEIPVVAPSDGVVKTLHVGQGDAVKRGEVLITLA